MKVFFSILAAAAIMGSAAPAMAGDIGGGFSLAPIAKNCQLLTSSSTGKPIIRVSSRDNRVVVIGAKKDCPKTHVDYPVVRLTTASTQGFIFVGADDKGRKTYIRKNWGSSYIFRTGPKPKT